MNVPKDLVEAYFYGNPESIASRILFIKREHRLPEYRHYLAQTREFGNVWHGLSGRYQGQQISIIATGIGPSLVGDAVYALDRPGAVCFYAGTCGGLAESLEIGDYFVADQAICGDGYSFHLGHAPLSRVSGDPGLVDSLIDLLGFKLERISSGISFTTSSVVREADLHFWDVVDEQSRVIEMGAAAFYAAAAATGKRAAAFFWVTDLPCRGKSFFDPLTPEELGTKQIRYDRSVELDLELLARI
jgi:purine-nucleoside phosphorylase